jgi:hypothetical protein
VFAVICELTAFLAHIHTENDNQGKQGQGKEKVHLGSVLFNSIIQQTCKKTLKKWLTSCEHF